MLNSREEIKYWINYHEQEVERLKRHLQAMDEPEEYINWLNDQGWVHGI